LEKKLTRTSELNLLTNVFKPHTVSELVHTP